MLSLLSLSLLTLSLIIAADVQRIVSLLTTRKLLADRLVANSIPVKWLL